MRRLIIACFIACLVLPSLADAQSAAARVTKMTVVNEQPRGDAVVVTSMPPGVVLSLLRQQGDWYQIALRISNGAPVGWIHRDAVELMGTQPASPEPLRESVGPIASGNRAALASDEDTVLGPGTTELMITGDFSGLNWGGETTSGATVDGTIGFVVSPHFEVIARTSAAKVSGVSAVGSIGGGMLVNFKGNGAVIPFAGGLIGKMLGASNALGVGGLVDDPAFISLTGGFRVMSRGGGGALIVRPFYERHFISSDFGPVADVNQFGVALGVSLLF